MTPQKEQFKQASNNFFSDLKLLFKSTKNPEKPIYRILWIVGFIFSGFVIAGALLGFVYAYNRISKPRRKMPFLNGQPRAVYSAMIAGGLIPFLLLLLWWFLTKVFPGNWDAVAGLLLGYLVATFLSLYIPMLIFKNWQSRIFNYFAEIERHGSARYADTEEILAYTRPQGFYVGSYYGTPLYYPKAGHLLTCAGTRAGKGAALILPNLLQPGLFPGSFVVVDPKGQNAAVSARIQREAGRKVVIINPWNLLQLGGASYNPLDLLKLDNLNLSDDVQMIAESIVPMAAGGSGGDGDHWNNRARSFIAGLLVYLVVSQPAEKKHIGTLWEWLRLPADGWIKILGGMIDYKGELAADIINAAGNEIKTLMDTSAEEYGSVISTAQRWTDFIKSPALRESLKVSEGFNSADLSDGQTTVYIIIPADRLKTHYQWLRLVVTSLMRSVVRTPKKDVCFLLDEFYALGYLSEIETALGTYAGYGIHVWAVIQNLVQLRDQYGNNWENFISSCSVRQFFNIADNTTAEYISTMFGQMSVPTYDALGNINGASGRNLVNPDELRRQSDKTIYAVLDYLAPAQLIKINYWELGLKYDEDPYEKRRVQAS